MDDMDNTSVGKISERAKPSLVTIGQRQVISNGRWNDELIADWVILHAQEKFAEVSKLAGVLGSNTTDSRRRVRKGLSRLFWEFRKRGQWLAVEYGEKRNAASAVKVADIRSELDRQLVEAKLKRMKRAKECSTEAYEDAIAVLHAMEAEREEA